MSVDFQHSEYDMYLPEWQLVQDCCDGQHAVKRAKSKYLHPMEGVTIRDKRYIAYLSRAVFVNYTGKTREGLTGAIFRNSPEIKTPPETEYLITNSDGAGESLVSLAKDVTGEVIAKGRHCLLVDYPQVSTNLTLEQFNELAPKATINRYTCENFLNWRVEVINGQQVMTLAVLCETYDAEDDEFGYREEKQYRVLRLDNGVYTQQLYREGNPVEAPYAPRMADGSTFGFIPLFIIGSENNDTTVDTPPLGDIANVNIAHYRNSADLEENCFVHGQLTLGVSSSMSYTQFQEANPEGILVGSMAGHFLGESGGFSSIQASENQLADRLMERKEEQMRKLGARMIATRGTKTATQALIEEAGETSIMTTIAQNVSEGIEKCIEWCGLFMGTTQEAMFELSTKFFDEVQDPQVLMAAMQLNEAGIFAKSDMQNLARAQGVVPETRTNEEIDRELLESDTQSDTQTDTDQELLTSDTEAVI